MPQRRTTLVLLVACQTVFSIAFASRASDSILDRPLKSHSRFGGITVENEPVKYPTRRISTPDRAASVQWIVDWLIMREGVRIHFEEYPEPDALKKNVFVDFDGLSTLTVRAVLDAICKQDPRYSYRLMGEGEDAAVLLAPTVRPPDMFLTDCIEIGSSGAFISETVARILFHGPDGTGGFARRLGFLPPAWMSKSVYSMEWYGMRVSVQLEDDWSLRRALGEIADALGTEWSWSVFGSKERRWIRFVPSGNWEFRPYTWWEKEKILSEAGKRPKPIPPGDDSTTPTAAHVWQSIEKVADAHREGGRGSREDMLRQHEERIEKYKEALNLLRRCPETRDDLAMRFWLTLGLADQMATLASYRSEERHVAMGKEAVFLFHRMLVDFGLADRPNHEWTLFIHSRLNFAYHGLGDREKMLEQCRTILRVSPDDVETTNPDVGRVPNDVCSIRSVDVFGSAVDGLFVSVPHGARTLEEEIPELERRAAEFPDNELVQKKLRQTIEWRRRNYEYIQKRLRELNRQPPPRRPSR